MSFYYTTSEVAAQLGVSRAHARQVLSRAGAPKGPRPDTWDADFVLAHNLTLHLAAEGTPPPAPPKRPLPWEEPWLPEPLRDLARTLYEHGEQGAYELKRRFGLREPCKVLSEYAKASPRARRWIRAHIARPRRGRYAYKGAERASGGRKSPKGST